MNAIQAIAATRPTLDDFNTHLHAEPVSVSVTAPIGLLASSPLPPVAVASQRPMLRVNMDWKLALTTFGTVFLAELGDKTQLATLAFATTGHSRWSVFIGAACALVATSAIAVLAGEAIARTIPPNLLKRAAGLGFVAMGVWVLRTTRSAG